MNFGYKEGFSHQAFVVCAFGQPAYIQLSDNPPLDTTMSGNQKYLSSCLFSCQSKLVQVGCYDHVQE